MREKERDSDRVMERGVGVYVLGVCIFYSLSVAHIHTLFLCVRATWAFSIRMYVVVLGRHSTPMHLFLCVCVCVCVCVCAHASPLSLCLSVSVPVCVTDWVGGRTPAWTS
jgi:hypothetical protein